VSPKRGDDVAPPPVDGEWRLRFATNEAAKGWGELGSEAPGNTRRCFEALTKRATPFIWCMRPLATPRTPSSTPNNPVAGFWLNAYGEASPHREG
jgi:hypothetical protein